jgi:hypothetical protein
MLRVMGGTPPGVMDHCAMEASPGGYTCPMHPEIRTSTPGDCPKCGMPLEPITSNWP